MIIVIAVLLFLILWVLAPELNQLLFAGAVMLVAGAVGLGLIVWWAILVTS